MKTFALICSVVALLLGLTAWAANESGIEVVHVKGIINAGTARYLIRAIRTAEQRHAALVLVVLDTPGGLLASTRDIIQAIDESTVPVEVYVAPGGASATSAGTIITMASHVAGMAPGTNIGAAHPVGGQGEDIKGTMKEKAENDTVAFIKSQAILRKRNAEWAEQAIRKSASATADEALTQHVVDFIAPDLAHAILAADGRTVTMKGGKEKTIKVAGLPVATLDMTPGESLLAFLGDPNVSYLLMAVGGLAIYAELSTPGVIIPGIVGVICLILAFVSFSTLPVNYGAVALLLLGIMLFIAEIFVTSYGALTIGGIVSLILGALFLLDASTGDLRLSLALVLPTVLALASVTAFVGYVMLKSRRTRYKGLADFAGLQGVVVSLDASGRNGKCQVRGEIWDFELAGGQAGEHALAKTLHVSDKIEITDRRGFRLIARHL